MKNQGFILHLAFLALIVFAFPNCSKKSGGGTVTPPATTFKFTVNGTIYNWNGNSADNPLNGGSRIFKTSYNGSTWYGLAASPANSGLTALITLKLNTATLSVATYTWTATSVTSWTVADHYCGVPTGLICTSSEIGDYATVIITNKHDGYVDGTFTARLTNADGSLVKVNVTDGEFHNVKIVE